MNPVRAWFVFMAALLTTAAFAASAATADGKTEIARFNQKLIQLHLNMDDAGILATWADDGVDLMPNQAPIVGKAAITAWMHNILASLHGYKVTKQEMDYHDIRVAGDWASEWATVHQQVQPPDGKPPIDSYGKIALVLRRGANGDWKIVQEMWNNAPQPSAPPKQ